MSLENVLVATLLGAIITFATRVMPFIFFRKKEPSPVFLYIGKYIPPVMITILVLFCLKDIRWQQQPHGLYEVLAVTAVLVLHHWQRNPLLSIFVPTVLYMFLLQTDCLLNLLR